MHFAWDLCLNILCKPYLVQAKASCLLSCISCREHVQYLLYSVVWISFQFIWVQFKVSYLIYKALNYLHPYCLRDPPLSLCYSVTAEISWCAEAKKFKFQGLEAGIFQQGTLASGAPCYCCSKTARVCRISGYIDKPCTSPGTLWVLGLDGWYWKTH